MAAPHDPRDPAVAEWGRLIALENRLIPLDEAVLTIARCARPDLDVVGELARLDDLAASCPSPTVEGIVRHLFGDLGFAGDRDTYDDPRNSFLDQVLDRRRGIPISLSVLTIEVARRLGVRLHGVGLPGHFVIGSGDDPDLFVDPFGGGAVLDATGLRMLFRQVSGGSTAWDPAWLAPVDHRALLVRMLNNLKASYLRRRDVTGLRWVMRLRARTSATLFTEESDEFRRLMAPTN